MVRNAAAQQLQAAARGYAVRKRGWPWSRIRLTVVDQEGIEIFFTLKRRTRLGKLMSAYCQRQGLATEESGAPLRDVLRRAALCRHATDERPASSFEWQCVLGKVQSRCRECSRIFGVSLSNGCMDTPSFASKLVTRAEFRALHEAPSPRAASSVRRPLPYTSPT